MEMLARLHIEHFHGVVAEGGDEDPLRFQVGAKVIDSAIDAWQGNPRLQRQSAWLLRQGDSRQYK
jgi:hypothetical protein